MGYTIYGRPRPQKGSCGDSFFCQPTVQQYELSIIRTDMCCQYIRRKFFFVKLTHNSKTLKKIKIFQLLAVSTIFCQYTFFSGISKLRCCCSNSRRNYYFHILMKKSCNLQILPFANKCISLEVQYLGIKFRWAIIKKI